MPLGAAELTTELSALAAASRDALTRLRGGDERDLVALLDARERLVQLLEATTVMEPSAPLVEAARDAVALDSEITAVLEQQRSAVAQRLERLVSQRRSLAAYGGRRGNAPLYVERLG
jgi:hypothetical protein